MAVTKMLSQGFTHYYSYLGQLNCLSLHGR